MSQVDLEEVIQNAAQTAVEDAVSTEPIDSTTDTDTTPDTTPETPLEAVQDAPGSTNDTEVSPEPTDGSVASPTAKAKAAEAAPQDDFEKKFGIPRESSPGRENRIPHSRVVKIVGKAIKDAEAAFAPKLQEFETKIKEYEAQTVKHTELQTKVNNFEKVLVEDKPKFLQMLRNVPGYAELLDAKAAVPVAAGQPAVASPEDGRPEPDQELESGAKVYSLEGLDKLNAWNRAQARKETLEEVKKIYGPIADSYEEQQKQAQFEKYQREVLIPQVEAQMKDARSWNLFAENEDAIVKVLNEHPEYNLERAYQTVVFPKLLTGKDAMRKQILEELRKAPAATSAPVGGTKPSAQPIRTGPRDNEDIIREKAAALNGR